MNKRQILFLIFLIGLSQLYPQAWSLWESSYRAQWQSLNESWLNGEMDRDSLLEKLDDLDRDWGKNDDLPLDYWRARANLFKGQIYYESGNRKESLKALEKSLILADAFLAFHETSDAWRVKSEANSLILLQKGFAYKAANYNRVPEQARKALELDGDNARAAIVLAQYYCNAPPIAGGNLSEGLAMLKNLLNREGISGIDKYSALRSLVMVYTDKGNMSEAAFYRRQAEELYRGGNIGEDQ